MIHKRYTYRGNIIYRNGLEYSTLNPDDICSLLDSLEENSINMDNKIKELKIENQNKFNKKEFEDSLYEACKLYAEGNNLTYSERLLLFDFSKDIIATDVFQSKKNGD